MRYFLHRYYLLNEENPDHSSILKFEIWGASLFKGRISVWYEFLPIGYVDEA
jgi:hypothetical protein